MECLCAVAWHWAIAPYDGELHRVRSSFFGTIRSAVERFRGEKFRAEHFRRNRLPGISRLSPSARALDQQHAARARSSWAATPVQDDHLCARHGVDIK